MTEGEWINKNDSITKEEWEAYQGSAEDRFNAAGQAAGQNAIAASGIADAMVVSCDFVNYDYCITESRIVPYMTEQKE